MPEGVVTAEGKPLDLDAARDRIDRDFAAAMAEPAGDEKAPPKRAPREPAEPPADKPRVTSAARRSRPPKDASKGSKDAAPVATHADRAQAVQGIVQLVAAGCVVVSQRVPDPVPFQADAVTLASNSESLAEAVAVTCDTDARLAALVDRIAIAGPYAALISAVMGVGMQVARNHGVPVPGTQEPREMVSAATEVSAKAAA